MQDSVPVLPPTLKTAHLHLRPLRPGDEQAIFDLHSDAEAMRYWRRPPMQSVSEAYKRLRQLIDSNDRDDAHQWALSLSEDGALIGTVGLFRIDKAQQRGEVGCSLQREYWGRGYAFEAVSAAIVYGLETLGLRRIEADVDARNQTSHRLLTSLGFKQEGVLRQRWRVAGTLQDSALYGLLAEDWVAHQAATEPAKQAAAEPAKATNKVT